jgi:L-malate glycosyltransferase
MHVDQVLVGASPGDAVTESALRIRDALRLALDADVYALHIDERLRHNVGRIQDYPLPEHRSAADVLILHVSIGEPRILDFVLHRSERVFLIYHNITPSHFFRAIDPRFAALLEDGRRSLRDLLAKADAVFADSQFNADELAALGRNDVVVCAPPARLSRLLEIEPDPDLVAQLPVAVPNEMILFVGQVLPHKRPEVLLGAHHLLVTNALPSARLVIAGANRHPRYGRAVRRLITDMNLNTVWLTGEVPDAALAAFYRRADVFVTASEHEGFCVPIIEAFHFGVPVVARAFGAIAETAGDAAIILDPDGDARHLAEAARRVLVDRELRAELVARGRARAAIFEADTLTARMLRALRDAIGHGAARS